MIIVKLWGGLGNQMFQYAAARALALRNSDALKLDISWFDSIAPGDTPRKYELGVYPVAAEPASKAESRRLCGPDIRRCPKILKRLAASIGYQPPKSCIRESSLRFDPAIMEAHGDIYLDGYWQSEKYFVDAAEIIRREFTPQCSPEPVNAGFLQQIGKCSSVSVHFRRGDYVTNPHAAAYHGFISPDYYSSAMAEISRQVPGAHFFLFSDDVQWVRENLRSDFPVTYVDGNGEANAYEDIRLMSACRHHIIANSSFSWWGAWLGANQEKVVIAPERWFNSDDMGTEDLIPEGWLRL